MGIVRRLTDDAVYIAISDDYLAVPSDDIIDVDTSSKAIQVTLPEIVLAAQSILTVLGGADLVNDEGFTLVNAAGTSVVFKYNIDGGGVSGEDVAIAINSADTPTQVGTKTATDIDGHASFTATSSVAAVTAVQATKGAAGNRANSEGITDPDFLVPDFTGGGQHVVAGNTLLVKDAGFNANTNNITVVGADSETLDGGANDVINVDKAVQRYHCDGDNWLID